MTSAPRKCNFWVTALAVLAAMCVASLATMAYLSTRPTTHRADLYYAFDIVESFGHKAAEAAKGNTTEACEILWELHYPNFDWDGKPQPFQGRLDNFVEGQRRRAIGEVIRYLRAKTGEDLGSDPEKWLLKYGSQSVKDELNVMKNENKTNGSHS